MTYLDEAAAELRKARADNEKRAETAAANADGKLPSADLLAEVNARRMQIAEGFVRLAAIEACVPLAPARAEPQP